MAGGAEGEAVAGHAAAETGSATDSLGSSPLVPASGETYFFCHHKRATNISCIGLLISCDSVCLSGNMLLLRKTLQTNDTTQLNSKQEVRREEEICHYKG